MNDELSGHKPVYVITLVHGTFAKGAAWVKPGSKLCTHLQKTLPGHVEIRSFEWSGKNEHLARAEAVSELKNQLTRQVDELPHADHYIVAHSHGGNIALYALADPTLQDRIIAAICLNTPFIAVLRRNMGNFAKMVRALLLLFIVAGMSWLTVLAVAYLGGDLSLSLPEIGAEEVRPWWHVPLAAIITIFSLVITPIGLAAYLLGSLLSLVTKKGRARREELIAELQLPNISKTRILCVNNADDEVHILFSVLLSITHLPYILLHHILLRTLVALVLLFGVVGAASVAIYGPNADQIGMLRQMEPGLLREFLAAVLFGMSVLSSVAILPPIYVFSCAFIASFINLLASHVPLGMLASVSRTDADPFLIRFSTTQVPVISCHLEFHDLERSGKILGHLVPYDDEETLNLVARRIRELRKSGRTPAGAAL
jgi:hypothetical protein